MMAMTVTGTNAEDDDEEKKLSDSALPRLPAEEAARSSPNVATKTKGSTTAVSSSRNSNNNGTSKKWVCVWLVVLAVIVLVLVITLPIVLTRKEPEGDDRQPPVSVDFSTGVSLITSYKVNATVRGRLMTSVVEMQIDNALDCASIHSVTLQLPLGARIASLETLADDECRTVGQVKPIEDARESFAQTASEGLPGAYVEERNSRTHALQVSIPPLGFTRARLVLEQVLEYKVGRVEFEIPLVPNEQVDQIFLGIQVLDGDDSATSVGGGIQARHRQFTFTNGNALSTESTTPLHQNFANVTTTASNNITTSSLLQLSSPYEIDIPDARQHKDLPRILRGSFRPGLLQSLDQTDGKGGILYYSDTGCFEHVFRPSGLDPMPKNLFFLLDTSESMQHNGKLYAAKQALKALIDSLTPNDTLTIQTFGRRGTMQLWGSAFATPEEKTDAKRFVDSVQTDYGGTNVHEAYLEGLLRAKRDAAKNPNKAVTILMTVSDGWPSVGETDRAKIVQDVWKLNKDGSVKIFGLGLDNSDMELLRAIAIMNGGVADSLYSNDYELEPEPEPCYNNCDYYNNNKRGGETYVDLQKRMGNFFTNEFGKILLSDVRMDFADDSGGKNKNAIYGETRSQFPVLADGTELVVRGRVDNITAVASSFRALTTANTKDGEKSWSTSAVQDPFVIVSTSELQNSRCFQSYAHSRITQLLHYRDATNLLGDEVMAPVVTLVEACPKFESLAECIEKEALNLALEAKVVVRGLTGLVTEDDDKCLKPFLPEEDGQEVEVCLDGTSKTGYRWEDEYGYGSSNGDAGRPSSYYGTSGGDVHNSSKLAYFVTVAMSAIVLAVSVVV